MGGVDNYGARRQEKSRPTQSDQDKVPKNTSLVLTAFQTACLAVIVMNATFIGNLLYHSLFNEYARKQSWQSLVFLILVVILNFLEIINNCASISKYFESFYNSMKYFIFFFNHCLFWPAQSMMIICRAKNSEYSAWCMDTKLRNEFFNSS